MKLLCGLTKDELMQCAKEIFLYLGIATGKVWRLAKKLAAPAPEGGDGVERQE